MDGWQVANRAVVKAKNAACLAFRFSKMSGGGTPDLLLLGEGEEELHTPKTFPVVFKTFRKSSRGKSLFKLKNLLLQPPKKASMRLLVAKSSVDSLKQKQDELARVRRKAKLVHSRKRLDLHLNKNCDATLSEKFLCRKFSTVWIYLVKNRTSKCVIFDEDT